MCSPTPVAVPAGTEAERDLPGGQGLGVDALVSDALVLHHAEARRALEVGRGPSAQSAMMRNSARASFSRASAGSSVSMNTGSSSGGACSRMTA